MVLCFAVAEGSANDWLSLALIDGYDVRALGRRRRLRRVRDRDDRRAGWRARSVLDRFGRAPVLWATAAAAALGIVLVVVGDHVLLVGLGIVVWGLGASLGFPVGMSAAADEPARAAARVSVVSTIGYGAFLAGPPLLGALGDEVGTLDSLLVVAALMGPAMLAVFATRRPRQAAGVARITPAPMAWSWGRWGTVDDMSDPRDARPRPRRDRRADAAQGEPRPRHRRRRRPGARGRVRRRRPAADPNRGRHPDPAGRRRRRRCGRAATRSASGPPPTRSSASGWSGSRRSSSSGSCCSGPDLPLARRPGPTARRRARGWRTGPG